MEPTLRVLRVSKGWTQAEVAKRLGINQGTYSALESLDKRLLEKIAKLYGIAPDDIKVVS